MIHQGHKHKQQRYSYPWSSLQLGVISVAALIDAPFKIGKDRFERIHSSLGLILPIRITSANIVL